MDGDDFDEPHPRDSSGNLKAPAPMAGFDFDALAALAKSDPDAFEQARTAMLHQQIERMKPLRPERLRGLLFRLDTERRRCKSLANHVHFSTLMWECFFGLEAPLSDLVRRIESSLRSANNRQAANDDSFR